jgi:hypothetical protein
MKLTTVFTILVVVAVAGVMFYLFIPYFFQNTYQGTIAFDNSGEANLGGQGYYTGGSSYGPIYLKPVDTVLVEEKGNPCGSSCLQYNYVLLIDDETGEVVDAAKFTIMNPSRLESPYQGSFRVGVGVIKSILYDPENSVGDWELEITVKKNT